MSSMGDLINNGFKEKEQMMKQEKDWVNKCMAEYKQSIEDEKREKQMLR